MTQLQKNMLLTAIVTATLLLFSTGSMAASTGTEFQTLFTWIQGIVQGFGGKAAALAAVALGAIFSLARVNPIPILAGIGFAIFLNYSPGIIVGIMTATV
ncbi:MAG: hypothetical protein KF908_10450 [Nitrosomonas sp.]|jgi:conjugal transfer pilus assembly protein TraA|uniref:Conjugal transfer pilus assembly protein TraA n=1 Tax=Nitrosomonas aestuarii TaxID=52441 RepID=A0A1I4DMC9_9PROT|nr:TraA family conjugative transfer protein [Nitrosomonas aestuarii]MBX3630304.1 hypothetical protein [Nitrosomonas sp.]SFK93497.1 conjugal transfer pilus assembly protein TraA [Nitrosomonas aestuarii]